MLSMMMGVMRFKMMMMMMMMMIAKMMMVIEKMMMKFHLVLLLHSIDNFFISNFKVMIHMIIVVIYCVMMR